MTSNTSLVAAAMLLVVLLAAYGYVSFRNFDRVQVQQTNIANPAATHCVNLGGTLEIRKDSVGAQSGFCVLVNGRTCEEWALFRDGTCVEPQ